MNPHLSMSFMVSPAVQRQVPHPSIVPEFLRSTSCGMTSAHGHRAIVYCLNSGSEDRLTGRHNWKKRVGRERREKVGRERTEKEKKESRGERDRSPPCMEKRAESGIGVKKTMNAGGVEKRID
ncbi:hypothetical protein TNCV_4292231 [Trichonephila clavipes]|uniref:Uncharacterized protein n=1 Tax=Trichonephila clavipes TaxID=2585209 RepID=A0A8X6RFR6_TRICX|nr:hypothetical protein TNCV_4292231 [Trichonephila clavipes]